MKNIKGISTEKSRKAKSVTSKQISLYFVEKGYKVCNVIPMCFSDKWFAFIIKNKEVFLATVFMAGKKIERFEKSNL